MLLKPLPLPPPIMGYPNYNDPFVLNTDASLQGLS